MTRPALAGRECTRSWPRSGGRHPPRQGHRANTSSIRYGLADSPQAPNYCACTATWADVSSRSAATRTSPRLGAHIPMMRERLKDIGFTEFCTFQDMESMFHKL
ncbi:MAG: hypothetical protein ACLTKG_03895 [Collinsella intestinalis]